MIIWLNGGFAAGKSTLADEIHRRLPTAVRFDPELVGLMLWQWLPKNDDFQDLPSWRELVIATALSLRRHHAETLIVPMSLINDAYREQILGALTETGEEIVYVFLHAGRATLRERLFARGQMQTNTTADTAARDWALERLDASVAAAASQPPGTLMLESDRLSPSELADRVLAAAGVGGSPWRAT